MENWHQVKSCRHFVQVFIAAVRTTRPASRQWDRLENRLVPAWSQQTDRQTDRDAHRLFINFIFTDDELGRGCCVSVDGDGEGGREGRGLILGAHVYLLP